jgi:type III restriction enzyme
MDENALGEDVHGVNVLTVIASESYESFARALQSELAEAVTDRPREVDAALFENAGTGGEDGGERTIGHGAAVEIVEGLVISGYVRKGALTDKYYEHIRSGAFKLPAGLEEYEAAVLRILGGIYSPQLMAPEDARGETSSLRWTRQAKPPGIPGAVAENQREVGVCGPFRHGRAGPKGDRRAGLRAQGPRAFIGWRRGR